MGTQILDEKEIELFFVGFRLVWPFQVANDQVAQVLFTLQAGALQELTQLPHLNAAVHLLKPLADALHHFRFGPVSRPLQFGTRRHVELVRAIELGIDAVQPPGDPPEGGYIDRVERGSGHCVLVIQSSGETVEQEELQKGDDLSR